MRRGIALRGWLSELPDAIEYRVVDGNLILWDTHAEIVIDALPGAFVVPQVRMAGKGGVSCHG